MPSGAFILLGGIRILIKENLLDKDKEICYTYDNNGNIISKRETEFTLKANVEESTFTTNAYEYAGDKLLSYKGETFVYDEIGNPTTYRGKTATWTMGRRLTSYNGHTFTYDAMGRRLTKDGISFTYDSDGKVIKQSNGLEFIYDYTGVVGFTYGNNTYIYRKDVQGNIIAILNSSGVVVVKYEYDAWGNHGIEVLDSTCETLANLNPFRYRGYYYDTETDLYFLKSRYYDPEIGRFMTIDGVSYLKPNAINGLNLYAYCNNNPVMGIDPYGNAWWNPFSWDWSAVGETINQVAQTISNTVQQVSSSIQTFVNNIQVDISNYDINNTDPQKVIEANYFSAYKGEFAIKLPIGENAFSYGIMVIGNDIDNIYNNSHINTILHEYGHYVQLQNKGFWRFTFEVAIPSVTGYLLTKDKGNYRLKLNGATINYYSQPWEYEADQLGGVYRGVPLVSITYWDLLKMF